MEVLYWQIAVVATVLFAYLSMGQRAARWTCVGWTVWTAIALAYAPLALIQLASAWGTYVLCGSFRGEKLNAVKERGIRVERDNEVATLRAQLNEIVEASQMPSSARSAIQGFAGTTPERLSVIVGADHLVALRTAISDAKRTLCILSGWIGSPLLDSEVQIALRGALKRRVRVYIGYGWESSPGGHELSGVALEALRFLLKLQDESKGKGVGELHIAQFANHEKTIVVDDAYLLIGSNNWLSNKAFRNTERSLRVEVPTLAVDEARRIIARVEKSEREGAYREILPLAEQGHASAQLKLGLMYRRGDGIPRDDAQTVVWLRKAAEQGLAVAQFHLGLQYSEGRGVPSDPAQALAWYRKAADQGHARAQFNVGNSHMRGDVVSKDFVLAASWYRKAAEQGLAEAEFNMGAMCSKGQGVPQDFAEALVWYERAASKGFAEAQNNLGAMYETGRGTSQDYVQAVQWYRKAAEQAHAGGQNNLGRMYSRGEGVLQDGLQATMWQLLAARAGNEDAVQGALLTAVKLQMTRSQIAEAEKLAGEWKPKGPKPT